MLKRFVPVTINGQACCAARYAAEVKGVSQTLINDALEHEDLPEIRIPGDRRRFIPLAALEEWQPELARRERRS